MNETNNREAAPKPTNGNETVPNADNAAENKSNEKEAENAAELTLEERERRLAEREKALEISERKLKAKELIKDKTLPEELLDFVDCTNDDAMIQSIDRLAEIICKIPSVNSDARNVMRIDTGLNHNMFNNTKKNDDFVKGLNVNTYHR